MKKLTHIFVFLFLFQFAEAQIHEIGIFAGGSNFIGDVGPTTYILPKQPAIGILYKWNKNPRYSWRFSAMYSKLKARDAKSDIESRKSRNYSFSNAVTELSAGFEFNFLDFNLHESGFVATPYISTGINYFWSDDLYVVNNKYQKAWRTGAVAIPIIAGYKMRVSQNFVLGLETGARYTFSDDIDGSFPKNTNLAPFKFGNTNSRDWYVFTGATLTYTFGNKPCYCVE